MYKIHWSYKVYDLLNKVGRLSLDFFLVVRDYYENVPEEKGKENTEFYKEMSSLIDYFEKNLIDMRDKLKDPDLIQGYDTK